MKSSQPNLEAYRYWTTHTRVRVMAVLEMAGISESMFSKIRRGHTYPSAHTAILLEVASRYHAEEISDFMRADRLLELERRIQQQLRALRSAA